MRFPRSPVQVWEFVTIARNPDIKSGQEEDTHDQTGDEASKDDNREKPLRVASDGVGHCGRQ
jgi:hypothetical protein